MKTRTRSRTDRRARAGATTRAAHTEPQALPVAGANDSRYFARIESAAFITDTRTGAVLHLDGGDVSRIIAALDLYADRHDSANARRLSYQFDAL